MANSLLPLDIVNVHEAKTELSRLLERVEHGEEIIIARAGKPVALLRRYVPPEQGRRQFGVARGEAQMADDFDVWPEDIRRALEEGEDI
jgi:antitoxin (DNA-binding transcriptional repressor) of toxin-antitoxin stability system